MFSYYGYTLEIKWNNKWQIVIMLRKIYVIDKNALFKVLYLIKNFKPCNKHLHFLTNKVGLVIKNIPVIIFVLQLKNI